MIISYICENCGKRYQQSLTQQMALIEEYERRSGDKYEDGDAATVCDPCYEKIRTWMEDNGMTEDDMYRNGSNEK